MASDRQIAANRENAKRCCGPTSPTGKAISSQNALKHGLDSKSEVMRCESRPDYEALIAEYYERFQPTVPEDRCLVDMLIKSEWHSRRYMSIDAGIWERGFLVINDRSLGRVFELSGKAFDRVDRRINSAQRNFQNALKQLMDIRAKRAKEPEIGTEPPLTVEPAPPLSAEPTPSLPSRDHEGAALETPQPAKIPVATKPLNPKLVSFLQNDSTVPVDQPEKKEPPPIAA